MATQKLQPSRALEVLKSDSANIPTPNLLVSGTATSTVTSELIDSNANFIVTTTNGVQYAVNTGDVVYCTSTSQAATIVKVVNATTLLLNNNIISSGNTYSIYQEGAPTGLGNQGAVLYIGGAGSLKVTTSGNDIVTFAAIQAGTFFPVNVVKVWSVGTDCTNIIALW
jgi:hypothetical protein